MYLLLLIYYCLLSDWAGFVGSYMIFQLNLYRLNLLKILVISVLNKYFAFNGRVDILCRISVSKIYARVNNTFFIERYICYAGFTLYTSNMYTCKYVYFRKDILKDIQLHV